MLLISTSSLALRFRTASRLLWLLAVGFATFRMTLLPVLLDAGGGGRPKVKVAGVQWEFPDTGQLLRSLDELRAFAPDAELFLLSEYTFDGPVPEEIRAWCRDNQRWLVVGGKDPLENDQYYNTAFVIG